MPVESVSSSFRDPSGFVFLKDDIIYRRINNVYRDHYDHLISSGLYQQLVDAKLLLPHEEITTDNQADDSVYKVIRPEAVRFISYPYEWCFGQLKDAAIATLLIQKAALEHGMILKDASAYNIQFRSGKPVLIDTLSFEIYKEGEPWVAYKQFCQHFLAPLVLMAKVDERLSQLLKVHVDGIPLDLAAAILPKKTLFSFSLVTHIHLHAGSQRRYADKGAEKSGSNLSRTALLGIVDNLLTTVSKLKKKRVKSEWGDYYNETNYDKKSNDHKQELVSDFLDRAIDGPSHAIWDLGANTGRYSRIAAQKKGASVLAFDIDHNAVEQNYQELKEGTDGDILPLLLDLTNPSPGIGWQNLERTSLADRGPADTIMALAVIHHLAIASNLPLSHIARFFAELGDKLIIEFIPKDDSQVERLLSSREDIFDSYDETNFVNEFGKFFAIVATAPIDNSKRSLYLMNKIR